MVYGVFSKYIGKHQEYLNRLNTAVFCNSEQSESEYQINH